MNTLRIDKAIGEASQTVDGVLNLIWPSLAEHCLKPYVVQTADDSGFDSDLTDESLDLSPYFRGYAQIRKEMLEKFDSETEKFPQVIFDELDNHGIEVICAANRFCIEMENCVPSKADIKRFLIDYCEEEEHRKSALFNAVGQPWKKSMQELKDSLNSAEEEEALPAATEQSFNRLKLKVDKVYELTLATREQLKAKEDQSITRDAILEVLVLYWSNHASPEGRDALSDAISKMSALRLEQIRKRLKKYIDSEDISFD